MSFGYQSRGRAYSTHAPPTPQKASAAGRGQTWIDVGPLFADCFSKRLPGACDSTPRLNHDPDRPRTSRTLKRTTTNPFVASEGYLFLIGAAVLVVLAGRYMGIPATVPPLLLLVYFFLIFRDPDRPVPAVPLGVVSPVDGEVIEVGLTDRSVLGEEAQVIAIRVNSLGAYTARSPVEGKVLDFATDGRDQAAAQVSGGLWLRTDEGDDVVLRFRGHRFGLVPKAFARYGERVGQGQRCAFLRLTRVAEVQVPVVARMQVKVGQSVAAGSDVLAKLPSH